MSADWTQVDEVDRNALRNSRGVYAFARRPTEPGAPLDVIYIGRARFDGGLDDRFASHLRGTGNSLVGHCARSPTSRRNLFFRAWPTGLFESPAALEAQVLSEFQRARGHLPEGNRRCETVGRAAEFDVRSHLGASKQQSDGLKTAGLAAGGLLVGLLGGTFAALISQR